MKEEFDMCSVEKWELQHQYSSDIWSKFYDIENLKNNQLSGIGLLLAGGFVALATVQGGDNFTMGTYIWGAIISIPLLWMGGTSFQEYREESKEIASQRKNLLKEIDDIIDKCNELELGITRQNYRDFMNREKWSRKILRSNDYMSTYLNYLNSDDYENAPQYIKDWWEFRLEQHETPEFRERVNKFWKLNQ